MNNRKGGPIGGRRLRKRSGDGNHCSGSITINFERGNIYFNKIIEKVALQQKKAFREVTHSEVVKILRTWNESNFEGIIAGVSGNRLKKEFDKKIREITEKIAEVHNRSLEEVTNDEIGESLSKSFIIIQKPSSHVSSVDYY